MREVGALLESGGWVGWGLVVVSILMWAIVWLRGMALGRNVVQRFSVHAQKMEPTRLEATLGRAIDGLAIWKSPLRVLVIVAPLLGLLGTVDGMVELFDSLHGSVQVRQGSVAGGISTALVTTQLGLVIGAPGLVSARLLDRLQLRRSAELRRAADTIRKGRPT